MKETHQKTNNRNRLRHLATGFLGVVALCGWIGGASAGEVTGSVAAAGPSYNLTTRGMSDWANWGKGAGYSPTWRFDHKITGGTQISDLTPVGAGETHGTWYDPARLASWTDGTPTASATDDPGYSWGNGPLNTGLQFTVPADTSERTVYVWCGGNGVTATLTAHLSDGSAVDYVDAQSGGAGMFMNLYTISYRADTAGQTLTITYLKTVDSYPGGGGSADLKAAWLINGPPNESPSVSITAPAYNASYTAPASITLTADATDSDGTVTNVEFFASGVSIGNDSSSPFSLAWNAVPAGSYSIKAKATDNLGAYSWSAPISVGVEPSGGGSPPYTGLELWLKGDAGVTLDGSTVSAWADQSGQGRIAAQGTAASQPALVTSGTGRPGVSFDGANDFLTFDLPVNGLNGMTIILVANNRVDKTSSGPQQAAIFWNETASWGAVYLSPFQSRVNFRFGTTTSGNEPIYVRGASLGEDYSLTVSHKDGDTDSLYVNGTQVWTDAFRSSPIAGCRSTGNLGLGYNDNTYFGGEILEVLVYTRALSGTERAAVELYLQNKYLANARPAAVITTPANNAVYSSSPANVTITATASDSDGTVTNVEFYAGSTLIGSDSGSPYSVVWNNAPGGAHTLKAKAIDNKGAFGWSAPIAIAVAGGSSSLTEGLVANLRFDGNYQDNTGNGVNGTAVGSPTFEPGFLGQAVHIHTHVNNGTNNYVTLGYPELMKFGTNDFSFAFWVKVISQTYDPVFIGNQDYYTPLRGVSFSGSGGNRIKMYVMDENDNAAVSSWPQPELGPLGEWRHLAATFDRDGNGVMYVDGVEVRATDISSAPGSVDVLTNSWNIGQDGTGNYGGLHGYIVALNALMDDMGIWRKALTAAEVSEIYLRGQAGLPLPTPTKSTLSEGLVANLKFDNDYEDATANAVNGTPVGSPTFEPGKLGQAVHIHTDVFHGTNDYVRLGLPDVLKFGTNDFSFSFWVKVLQQKKDQPFIGNMDWWNETGGGLVVASAGTANGFKMKMYDHLNNVAATPAVPLGALGEWRHCVATFKRDGLATLYVDGVSATTTDISSARGSVDVLANSWNIGQDGTGVFYNGSYDAELNALMDDVGIWRKALTAAEVTEIYANGLAGISLPAPAKLKITRLGSQVVLSWPSTATGFALQKTVSLSPASWSAVTDPVVVVGERKTVALNLTGGESYYRLKK